MKFKYWIKQAPAGDDGADTGGTDTDVADRGDSFEPTDDDADKTPPVAKAPPEEPKPEDKPPKKDTRIPLERHQAVLERERSQRAALEKELAAYKQGQAVAVTNDELTKLEDKVVGLEAEYNKAMADGEIDKATKLMADIRRNERQIGDSKGEIRSQAAEARAYERVRFDNIVDRLEEAYPELRDGSDEFDQDKVNDVIELQNAYRAQGYTPADAMQKAAKLILGATTSRQTRAVDTDVRVDKGDLAKATAEERRVAQVAKNLDAAGKSPPSTNRIGADSDKVGGGINARDVIKLDQKEFAKIDEKTLARLRGDEL